MEKTLIAVVSNNPNNSFVMDEALIKIFDRLYDKSDADNFKDPLAEYCFVFEHSTFRRIIIGEDDEGKGYDTVSENTRNFLSKKTAYLRPYKELGNVLLCFLTGQKIISIIWHFVHPHSKYSSTPENNLLMRVTDIWNVKRLMNEKSVHNWIYEEAMYDANRNPQDFPISIPLRKHQKTGGTNIICGKNKSEFNFYEIRVDKPGDSGKKKIGEATLAIVVQDSMQKQFRDLVRLYERELSQFGQIVTTNITGKILMDNVPSLEHVYRHHSGENGGLADITMEILLKKCQAIFLFIDPKQREPYSDDFKVLIGATSLSEDVRLFTNELHFIEWIEHVVRNKIDI